MESCAGDVQAGRGVGGARAARDEADAGPAGELAVGLRHHRRAALLAADGDGDRRVVQRVEHGEIALARHAEDMLDAVRRRAGRPGSARRCAVSIMSAPAHRRRGSPGEVAGLVSRPQARVAQDLVRVLAEPRRGRARRPCGSPSMTIGERTVGIVPPFAGGRRQVDPHAARDHLRIGEDLGDGVDRPGRHACALERREQRRRGVSATVSAARSGDQDVAVARPGRALVRKSRVVGQLRARRAPRRSCANCPSLPTATMMWPSATGKHLVGHDVRMGVAHPRRRLARDEIVHRLVARARRPARRAAPCRGARPRPSRRAGAAPRGCRSAA